MKMSTSRDARTGDRNRSSPVTTWVIVNATIFSQVVDVRLASSQLGLPGQRRQLGAHVGASGLRQHHLGRAFSQRERIGTMLQTRWKRPRQVGRSHQPCGVLEITPRNRFFRPCLQKQATEKRARILNPKDSSSPGERRRRTTPSGDQRSRSAQQSDICAPKVDDSAHPRSRRTRPAIASVYAAIKLQQPDQRWCDLAARHLVEVR